MPFEIVRNDITHMQVDAIVNTANPRPIAGAGTDAMIHAKAGPKLLEARQKIGHITPGQAAITSAYGLDARYVIHTVGPVWIDGSHAEEALLRSCYDNALALARKHRCRSIAFPLISAGNYGFPRDKALQIAIAAFSDFLLQNDMQITLVVFHKEAWQLSEQLFQGLRSYIDQHYVDIWTAAAYEGVDRRQQARARRIADAAYMPVPDASMAAPSPKKAPATKEKPTRSLAELLKKTDAGFTETLLGYIDRSGKKDSEIYKKANLSKQHFSKIRNNPHYQPTKPTALALAIALELSLEDTKDLIGRAGFALTGSSKFDLIIRYFIESGNYNIIEINMALYEFDQSLLGS